MSAVLLAERERLTARIAEIDALLAVAPVSGFERPRDPEKIHTGFGIYTGSLDRIGEAWCSQWNRRLTFPRDLDRDVWEDEDELWAVVRTWYYLVRYGDGAMTVSACTVYQIVVNPDEPDETLIDSWLDYCENAADGYHRDQELRQMAIDDEAPTVEIWNLIVDKAGDSWAMLATGDSD